MEQSPASTQILIQMLLMLREELALTRAELERLRALPEAATSRVKDDAEVHPGRELEADILASALPRPAGGGRV